MHGSTTTCNTAYFPDRLDVQFVASSWPAGDWSFAVDDARRAGTLPGGTVTCTEGATVEISDREVTVVPISTPQRRTPS